MPFEVPQQDILQLLAEESPELEAQPDVDVPDMLLSAEQTDRLLAQHQPHYVPVGAASEVRTPPPAQPEAQEACTHPRGVTPHERHRLCSALPTALSLPPTQRAVVSIGQACVPSPSFFEVRDYTCLLLRL